MYMNVDPIEYIIYRCSIVKFKGCKLIFKNNEEKITIRIT